MNFLVVNLAGIDSSLNRCILLLDVVVAGAGLRHTVHIVRPKCRNVTRLTRLRISLRIHHNSGHTGGIEPLPPSVIFRCSTSELTVKPELCPGL